MPGALATRNEGWFRGWARLDEDPHYRVTVHLVLRDIVVASVLADGPAEDGEPDCLFAFDVSAQAADVLPQLSVMIGETGEMLGHAHDPAADDRAPPAGRRAVTYRDALANGLTAQDVIGGFYLDILKRPADGEGARVFLDDLHGRRTTFDHMRRVLLDSDEYARRRKRLGDAAGRTFANGLVARTAERVRRFEALLTPFLADARPLDERLTRYFPALHAIPGAREAMEADRAHGLPERELFFRALSHLAHCSSLVLGPEVLTAPLPVPAEGDAAETEVGLRVPVASRLMVSGWHRVENGHGGQYRWMDRIGVVADPTGGRALDRIEVGLNGRYAATEGVVAVSDRDLLVTADEDRAAGGRSLVVTGRDGPFRLDRLVLVALNATCPLRFDGSYDPRVISLNVADVTFVRSREAC